MRRVDATIYFGSVGHTGTIIWVDDDATDEMVEKQLQEDALEMIEFDWHYYRSEGCGG